MNAPKLILAATDFSESAENAVDYAAALAEATACRLVILHAYHLPLVTSEVPTMMFSLKEMEKEGMEQLKLSEERIRKNHPGLQPVELLCLHGFASETIGGQAEKTGADLIVTGLQGSGFFAEKIIGSNSFELAQGKKCPVLIVHHELKFRPIKRVLLATDEHEIRPLSVLDPLRTYARLFGAEVLILHVRDDEKEIPGIEAAVGGIQLDHFLEGIPHTFHSIATNHFMEGLNRFADQHRIDLTVALARTRGFFEGLLRRNHLQDLVYHIHTPLLTLHE